MGLGHPSIIHRGSSADLPEVCWA